jgi:hypothetical protein
LTDISLHRQASSASVICDDPDDDESGDKWIFPNGESNYYYYIHVRPPSLILDFLISYY